MFEQLKKDSPKHTAFFRVSGNSGIGKSYSMLYLLKLFLNDGRMVFFDDRNSGHVFAFIPVKHDATRMDEAVSYNVFAALVDEFRQMHQQGLLRDYPEEAMPPVLWDPSEQDMRNFQPNYLGCCRTVLAVSLKEALVKNPEKDFDIDTRYLPQYSLAHLETIRQMAYPSLDLQELRYRYYRYGGLLRFAFADKATLREFDSKIKDSIYALTQESLEKILQNVIGDQYNIISLGVFEVKPDPSNPSMKVFDFGSPYVYALVVGRFWEFMARLGRGENRRYTTWFEAMVIHRLAEGGTFKIRKLENSQQEQWTHLVLQKIPVKNIKASGSLSVNDAFYSAWAELQEGNNMLAPVSDNLPVVDCADRAWRGYQITAAQDTHTIAYEECGKILTAHEQATLGSGGQLELYFAVPDWNAKGFKKQTFRGVGQGNRNIHSERVEQYVLKIDCEHVKSLAKLYDERKDAVEKSFNERVENAENVRKRRRLQVR